MADVPHSPSHVQPTVMRSPVAPSAYNKFGGRILEPIRQPPPPALLRAVVLHTFEPQLAGELMVEKGEVILCHQSVGHGWCVASNSGGAKGLVPESYLQALSAEEQTGIPSHAVLPPPVPPPAVEPTPAAAPMKTASPAEAVEANRLQGPECDWVLSAEQGELADLVLVYDKEKKHSLVEPTFEKLREAGLRVVKRPSPHGKFEFALLTPVSEERLEKEAQFRQLSLLLKNTHMLVEGEAHYADFTMAHRDMFALKNGQLFSPIERQHLVTSIAEGSQAFGCAELDLDDLVAEGVFVMSMALHSKEHPIVWAAWAGLQLWPYRWPYGWPYETEFNKNKDHWPLTIKHTATRMLPDFGLIQQPLHAIQAYLGTKVAFYFAWAEKYTCWLLCLVIVLIPLEIGQLVTDDRVTDAYILVVLCVCLGACSTFLTEYWNHQRVALAYTWDVLDFEQEARPRPEFLRSARVGRWRLEEHGGRPGHGVEHKKGFFAEGDVFIDEDTANPLLVMNKKDRAKVYLIGAVLLFVLSGFMIASSLTILTLQMLWTQARQFEHSPLLRDNGTLLGSIIITIQVGVMNVLYKRLAVYLTNVENQRTETAYENSLILKVTLFQFCNSYFALFYISFMKSRGYSMFGAFGYRDRLGRLYKDTCGSKGTEAYSIVGNCSTTSPGSEDCRYIFVRGDCMEELRTLMISHLVLKPFAEVIVQLVIPWCKKTCSKCMAKRKRTTSVRPTTSSTPTTKTKLADRLRVQLELEQEEAGSTTKAQTKAQWSLVQKIYEQMLLPPSSGTFEEYRSKVIQFGYVAMFSAAFPIGAVAATVANILEIRVDAYKFMFSCRRPMYEDADDIGNWKLVMQIFSWIALVINVLVVAYASNLVRDYIVIPMVAERSVCEETEFDYLVSDEARFLGLRTSWRSPCPDNYRNCFVDIGGVPWLPGSEYLSWFEETSQSYLDQGLCNEGSRLYNAEHCTSCKHRTSAAYLGLSWFVIVVEHVLILLKYCIMIAIPDKPKWVRKNEARVEYLKEKTWMNVSTR